MRPVSFAGQTTRRGGTERGEREMSRNQHRMFELTQQQCRDRMAKHQHRLGRLAFAEDADPEWPTILPINYVYHDGQVYFRTFEGSKLYAALRRQRVAFEIDAVDDDWRQGWSVVALGTLEVVSDADQRATVEELLTSWAAPSNEQLVRLRIEALTGREVIAGA
jgi:nitroimidazol reductase NimA-like FMN-containing flavoprotein (pyridoxamine 5'-phosphate oxidase superfamily)